MDDYELPESLDFHIPSQPGMLVELKQDDDIKLHRQLVCWCLIQRYWYYIKAEPQTTDGEYDAIEKLVKQMESEAEYLCNNKYSPTKRVASSRPEDYPAFVRFLFSGA